jgi:hypothetical protein
MIFELTARQEKELKEWQEKIKDLYGEYGTYTFKFTPTGIGNGVVVYSHLTKLELDISHQEEW